jgi:hypothetical protein
VGPRAVVTENVDVAAEDDIALVFVLKKNTRQH